MSGARRSIRDLTFNMTENIFSFDDKIFSTLIYLLFVPGKLTKEYMKGRIVSYVHPSKLFWFISILFFTLLTIHIDKEKESKEKTEEETGPKKEMLSLLQSRTPEEIEDNAQKLEASITQAVNGSANKQEVNANIKQAVDEFKTAVADTNNVNKIQKKGKKARTAVPITPIDEYDEDGELKTILKSEKFIELFKTYAPYAAFFLIPVFALHVMILFKRKGNFFVDYFAFSMHFHAFVFMLGILFMATSYVFPDLDYPNWVVLIPAVYFLRAAWVVFRPSIWGVLWRTGLIVFSYAICIFVFTILFVINLAYQADLFDAI